MRQLGKYFAVIIWLYVFVALIFSQSKIKLASLVEGDSLRVFYQYGWPTPSVRTSETATFINAGGTAAKSISISRQFDMIGFVITIGFVFAVSILSAFFLRTYCHSHQFSISDLLLFTTSVGISVMLLFDRIVSDRIVLFGANTLEPGMGIWFGITQMPILVRLGVCVGLAMTIHSAMILSIRASKLAVTCFFRHLRKVKQSRTGGTDFRR